jgi:hypothetical protein
MATWATSMVTQSPGITLSTPAGMPVAIMTPGYEVDAEEAAVIMCRISTINLRVFAHWPGFAFQAESAD